MNQHFIHVKFRIQQRIIQSYCILVWHSDDVIENWQSLLVLLNTACALWVDGNGLETMPDPTVIIWRKLRSLHRYCFVCSSMSIYIYIYIYTYVVVYSLIIKTWSHSGKAAFSLECLIIKETDWNIFAFIHVICRDLCKRKKIQTLLFFKSEISFSYFAFRLIKYLPKQQLKTFLLQIVKLRYCFRSLLTSTRSGIRPT